MPMKVTDVDGGVGNIITAWGALSENEILDFYEAHFGQEVEKFKKYRYSLTDWSAVTKLYMSSDAVRRVVKRIADLSRASMKTNPDAIVATVASQDQVFGLTRMWEVFVDDAKWETMAFRNVTAAKEWIRERVEDKYGISHISFE